MQHVIGYCSAGRGTQLLQALAAGELNSLILSTLKAEYLTDRG